MTTPQSLQTTPFTDLARPKAGDKLFEEDYVHSAFETLKIKGVTTKGATWNYKAKVKLAKDLTATYDDELKVQFPFYDNRFFCWFGSRRSGDLKFHVDFGDVTLASRNFNLFTNIKTNTKFE
jgi:hypothetical protein